jgi:hypothetical protein
MSTRQPDLFHAPRSASCGLALVAALSLIGAPRALGQCPGRWVPDFGGGVTGAINALTLRPGGDLVAGGTFTAAGGVTAHYVARWNGSSWASVGPTGVFNPVLSLAVLSNGDLVAGGALESLNPITGRGDYIIRWNGSSWSNLGLGVQDTVYSLALGPDGQLLAGGNFIVAGGGDAFGIASWDGSNWFPLGTGVEGPGPFPANSGYVFAIAAGPGGEVFAGGTFSMASGLDVNRIARWDGVSWSPLDTGVTDPTAAAVLALLVLPNGDLIAGGEFTTAGSVQANNIARWDGTSWSALGAGLTNASGAASIYALALMPNGDLIAGGTFTSAGGVSANGIARWDGSSWSALGTGMTGGVVYTMVKALAVLPNGDLVAGGSFSSAGGIPASGIARWTTACGAYCDADFNHDGDSGTDADIEAFFACIAGNCCATCGSADFNGDGDVATDADIESFFRVLAGGAC